MASDELLQQIAREAEELQNVPKLPIQQFMTLNPSRCHICGRVVPASDLVPFDNHTGITRLACSYCHPQRGNNAQ